MAVPHITAGAERDFSSAIAVLGRALGFVRSRCHTMQRVPSAVLTQNQCIDSALRQASYSMTDLALTYRLPGDHWSIALWAKNFEDQAVLSTAVAGTRNSTGVRIRDAAVNLSPPRTMGARIAVNW